MTKHRRIEITAFRHQVRVVYGDPESRTAGEAWNSPAIRDLDSSESIRPDSAEGKRILADVIGLLRNHLGKTPE
jgi:hypothetical protein